MANVPNDISFDGGSNYLQKVVLADAVTGAPIGGTGGSIGSITITPVSSATATATQVTVPATANGILILAANANRKGAIISNPSTVTVYVQQAATGVTTSNGFGIPPGSSLSIDEPLYTGSIYGIVATSTQVVTVVEFT